MKILFAIDILEGRCVRLKMGNFNEVTYYSDDPMALLLEFTKKGVRDLHIVDLDGAREGKPKNMELIRNMRKSFTGYMQVGGGIRDFETVMAYLDIGVDKVILGTKVFTDPKFLDLIPEPERIILSIDLLHGKPMIRGWAEGAERPLSEVIEVAERRNVWGLLVTSIDRDGMLKGPDIESIREVLRMTRLPIIASGGVRSLSDVETLFQIGVNGVVVGKAIYEGTLKIEDLVRLTGGG